MSKVDPVDVVTAVSTVVLVLVTAYYAKKTKDMADPARDAAADSVRATAAAEQAALAARDTAAVAQSQVRVEFTGRTVAAHVNEAEWASALVIQSLADAVVVRKVQIRRAFRESQSNELDPKPYLEGLVLMPFNGESQLPRRLHQDEDLVVTHKSLQDQGLDLIETYILDIEYTFTEDGTAGGTRRLKVTR
jgi:hypothetical protein